MWRLIYITLFARLIQSWINILIIFPGEEKAAGEIVGGDMPIYIETKCGLETTMEIISVIK